MNLYLVLYQIDSSQILLRAGRGCQIVLPFYCHWVPSHPHLLPSCVLCQMRLSSWKTSTYLSGSEERIWFITVGNFLQESSLSKSKPTVAPPSWAKQSQDISIHPKQQLQNKCTLTELDFLLLDQSPSSLSKNTCRTFLTR